MILFYSIAVDKVEALKHYKFSLAFENSNEEDYVTEKFFQSLVAGMDIYFISILTCIYYIYNIINVTLVVHGLQKHSSLALAFHLISFISDSGSCQDFLLQEGNCQNLVGIECSILNNLININDDNFFTIKFRKICLEHKI